MARRAHAGSATSGDVSALEGDIIASGRAASEVKGADDSREALSDAVDGSMGRDGDESVGYGGSGTLEDGDGGRADDGGGGSAGHGDDGVAYSGGGSVRDGDGGAGSDDDYPFHLEAAMTVTRTTRTRTTRTRTMRRRAGMGTL